jgi:peptidoglycan/xylan/chitin deacetylase (PgdA/CDA1 family)
VGKDDRMNWDDIQSLEQEGHEIGSHSMNHNRLGKLSENDIKYEIIESRRCLQEKGFNVTSFSFPYNDGDTNKNIIKIIADNYYLGRTATEPLMFFSCKDDYEGFVNDDKNENLCQHSSPKNNENTIQLDFKRYKITGLSHEAYKNSGGYSDEEMYEKFKEIVDSQTRYNSEYGIRAIPILIYHMIDYSEDDYSINPDLFEKEMKYLFENGYQIFQMKDIIYDTDGLHIKGY